MLRLSIRTLTVCVCQGCQNQSLTERTTHGDGSTNKASSHLSVCLSNMCASVCVCVRTVRGGGRSVEWRRQSQHEATQPIAGHNGSETHRQTQTETDILCIRVSVAALSLPHPASPPSYPCCCWCCCRRCRRHVPRCTRTQRTLLLLLPLLLLCLCVCRVRCVGRSSDGTVAREILAAFAVAGLCVRCICV